MTIDEHLAGLVEAAVTRALEVWAPPAPAPAEERPRLLTVGAAAALMSISAPSVRRLIDSGQLRAVRCLGSVRVDRLDLDGYIESAKGGADD